MTHIPEDDLVLFALQLLPEDRMRMALEHVETCPQCRADVARLQGDLVSYAMTAEMAAPPPSARERLMRQVSKEPRLVPIAPAMQAAAQPEPAATPTAAAAQAGTPHAGTSAHAATAGASAGSAEPTFAARQSRILPIESHEEQRPRRTPWVLAWTGWAVAAGVSFFAGLQVHQRQQLQGAMSSQEARLEQTQSDAARAQDALATLTAANAQQVALHLLPTAAVKPGPASPAAAATPEAVAAYLADKGALVFVATHMQPVASGKVYELWLLPADGKAPIPAGTFKPDAQGSGTIVLPQIPKGVSAKGFGVTVENDGGSMAPTTPVMMAGT